LLRYEYTKLIKAKLETGLLFRRYLNTKTLSNAVRRETKRRQLSSTAATRLPSTFAGVILNS
jgi:hypothetical protein